MADKLTFDDIRRVFTSPRVDGPGRKSQEIAPPNPTKSRRRNPRGYNGLSRGGDEYLHHVEQNQAVQFYPNPPRTAGVRRRYNDQGMKIGYTY